jgi:hypothetical protein
MVAVAAISGKWGRKIDSWMKRATRPVVIKIQPLMENALENGTTQPGKAIRSAMPEIWE